MQLYLTIQSGEHDNLEFHNFYPIGCISSLHWISGDCNGCGHWPMFGCTNRPHHVPPRISIQRVTIQSRGRLGDRWGQNKTSKLHYNWFAFGWEGIFVKVCKNKCSNYTDQVSLFMFSAHPLPSAALPNLTCGYVGLIQHSPYNNYPLLCACGGWGAGWGRFWA